MKRKLSFFLGESSSLEASESDDIRLCQRVGLSFDLVGLEVGLLSGDILGISGFRIRPPKVGLLFGNMLGVSTFGATLPAGFQIRVCSSFLGPKNTKDLITFVDAVFNVRFGVNSNVCCFCTGLITGGDFCLIGFGGDIGFWS